MAGVADVIVVGAGIIGCAVAQELAVRGARVRVIEARTVAAGATQASAGMLVPYLEAHDRGPLFDLMTRSLDLYDAFIARVTTDSTIDVEYRRCGSLQIAADAAAAARFQDAPQAFPSLLRWLDADAARREEPSLPDSILGALLVTAHGYVNVNALTEALAWGAMRHGAEIEAGRRITAIDAREGTTEVMAEDGTRWTAETIVLASGSWTPHAGTADAAATHVRPIRGQLLRLGWRGAPLSHVIWGPDCYVVPWQDGTVLVGATMEDVGYDEQPTATGVRDLLDAVCELLPEAWRATFIDARAGLRPATSDGLPLVGRSASNDHVIYATGHFRNGILLAPLTAALVADLILDDRADSALDLMRPDRFSEPAVPAPAVR
jgi:glycine oxidase